MTSYKVDRRKAIQLAKSILSLPEGPTYIELAKQARAYLRDLSKEDYDKLKVEALSEEDKEEKYRYHAESAELLRTLGFITSEIEVYASKRLDSPGIRYVIARRAYLLQSSQGDSIADLSSEDIRELDLEVCGIPDRSTMPELLQALGVKVHRTK